MDRYELQERALVLLVKKGEAAYSHTIPEERDKKGHLVQFARKIYKVKPECRLNLQRFPRENPIPKRCCASCQHKDVIDVPIEGTKRIRQGVRVCLAKSSTEVSQCSICADYKMREAWSRI